MELRFYQGLHLKSVTFQYTMEFSTSVFPDAYKVAKLNPIYKKSKKTDPSNYRPIFLL